MRDILNSINWNGIISVLLGAAIAFFATNYRERQKIKKDIEISTANEMLKLINEIIDSIEPVVSEGTMLLILASPLEVSSLIDFKNIKIDDHNYLEFLIEVHHLEERYNNVFEKLKVNLDKFQNAFSARMIVLIQYSENVKEIFSYFDTVEKVKFEMLFKFEDLCKHIIKDNDYFACEDEYNYFNSKMKESLSKMKSILNDLSYRLQNDSLSKIFKQKIKLNNEK